MIRSSFLLLCFAVGILANPAWSQTYYVAPFGNNTIPLATAQNRNTPLKTIQVALNRCPSGSTIIVRDGNYWEPVNMVRSNVTLRSENKHGARLIGSIYGSDLNDLTIDGFEVQNRWLFAPRSKGISLNRCRNVVVRNNRVFNCRGGGISVDQSDLVLLEWNLTSQNAFWDVEQHSGISIYQPQSRGPSDGRKYSIIVRNNTSYGNKNLLDNPIWGRPTDGNGIVIDDTQNLTQPTGNQTPYTGLILVENNLCFNNGGQGVHCYQSDNVTIRNNTLINNVSVITFGAEVAVVRGRNVEVYNNILLPRVGGDADLQFESENVTWDYNLIGRWGNRGAIHGPNTIVQGPLLLPGSFEVQANSPVINAGRPVTDGYPLDVYGRPRNINGIDIGALER